jgi:hypothetical protein
MATIASTFLQRLRLGDASGGSRRSVQKCL